MTDIMLEGKPKDRLLDQQLVHHILEFVLDNLAAVEPLREEYQRLVEGRTSAHQLWRARHPGRSGSRAPNFLPELSELEPFSIWLRERVRSLLSESIPVDDTVEALSKFPSASAMWYRPMYAYGYHYRVRSCESHLKSSGAGIAATFIQECMSRVRATNPVTAAVEYAEYLDEIIELNYGNLCQVVCIGSWVRANYRGASATVKRDEWGFTIANFSLMIPFGRDSFALPLQRQCVFLS